MKLLYTLQDRQGLKSRRRRRRRRGRQRPD
jgi:hypothetical protein